MLVYTSKPVCPSNMGKPPFCYVHSFYNSGNSEKQNIHYCFELNMSQYVLKAHLHWKVLSSRQAEGKLFRFI